MHTIQSIAAKMPEKTQEDILMAKQIPSKVLRNKKVKNQQSLIRQRGELLKQIESLYLNSPLNDK